MGQVDNEVCLVSDLDEITESLILINLLVFM